MLRLDEQGFRNKLMNWYSKCRRALPWRFDPTPYRVWISEIMLQQTQVAAASSYYVRFIKHFPDLESLANASEEEILNLWAGLGYYHRARNLSKTAREIYKFHNGVFPTDLKTMLALPGIGRYTAGAICSLAFNQSQPIVDGNIRRVIIRFNGIMDRVPEKYFWKQMEAWIPDGKASIFNQAMMELGALVCTPIQPHCAECPIKTHCQAQKMNIQARLPRPSSRKPAQKVSLIILLLKRKNKILLTNEMPDFIPGRWGFPSRLIAGDASIKDAALHLSQDILDEAIPLSSGVKISHAITFRQIAAHIFTGDVRSPIRLSTNKFCWIEQSKANEIPTSSIFLKALKKITNERCR
jgi:A/G-specific adenine glycosylase